MLDRIRTDASEPALLRSVAPCLRPAIKGVPPQIDVSAVRLAYLCGNRFRVRNPTTLALTFAFAADRTGERRLIGVPAGGESSFSTDAPSTVRLYYDGRLIQTQANGGTRCSR